MAKQRQRQQQDKTTNRIMCGAGTIAILGIGGFLVWKYALGSPTNVEEFRDGVSDAGDYARKKWDELDLGNFTDVLDGLDGISFGDLFQEDPSYGDGETTSWVRKYVKPGNGGLHLTLQNALDETWQQPFQLAVADWNESPALTLTTQRVAVDHTCTPVPGVMVVCNGNFGETGWVGINENSIQGGYIIESVSKMNEFYLRNANAAHRRFTMCHEIGHGLGLPHTDENPYNRNLGDCLDYTDDPEENLYPGEVNFDKVAELYLTRRFLRTKEDGTLVEKTVRYVRDELKPEHMGLEL